MPLSHYTDVGRIIAIGDLHGNYDGLCKILDRCGLIDGHGHWHARDTHLVQLGDILGRGGAPGKIFRLLKRLEAEAVEFGSRVHLLLGNHEAMSMSGLLIYNTFEEFQDLADQNLLNRTDPSTLRQMEFETAESPEAPSRPALKPVSPADLQPSMVKIQTSRAKPDWSPTLASASAPSSSDCAYDAQFASAAQPAHGEQTAQAKLEKRLHMLGCRDFRAALAPEGKVGRWLAQHDSAIQLNDCLFVHGGLNREWGCMPLDTLNDLVRSDLTAQGPRDAAKDIMLRRDGPQWNREFTLRPSAEKQRELQEVLDYHGAVRMIVGHTPTSCINPSKAGQIVSMYHEKLICIDTGIGKSYGEKLSALSIEKEKLTPIYV